MLEWTLAKYNCSLSQKLACPSFLHILFYVKESVVQIYQTFSYLTDGSGKLPLYFLCDLLTFITIIEHNYRTSRNHACDIYTFIISTEQNDHI